MAYIGRTINVDDLPKQERSQPVPEGTYDVCVSKADVRRTKAGTGDIIYVQLDVSGPTHEYVGRTIPVNLNISNPSPKAEEIGKQQLRALMEAIGLVRIQDTDELVGQFLQVRVGIKQTEGYGPENVVKAFLPSKTKQQPAQSQQTAKPAAQTPSWMTQREQKPAAEKPQEPAIFDEIPF